MNNFMGYTNELMDHFDSPRNILKTTEEEFQADGVGEVGNPQCGDMMKVWIKVDKKQDRIVDLKWKTFGCASAIGSTSVMSEMVIENDGMKINTALELTPQDIMDRVGGLPSIKIHCSVLGDKALRSAINNYLEKTGQKDRIEEVKATIICNCLNVTDHEIEEQVLDGVEDFEILQEKTKISTGCGQCKDLAVKTFDQYRDKYFSKKDG